MLEITQKERVDTQLSKHDLKQYLNEIESLKKDIINLKQKNRELHKEAIQFQNLNELYQTLKSENELLKQNS